MAAPQPSQRHPWAVPSKFVALNRRPTTLVPGLFPPADSGPPSRFSCPKSSTPRVTVPFVMIAAACAPPQPLITAKVTTATVISTALAMNPMAWTSLPDKIEQLMIPPDFLKSRFSSLKCGGVSFPYQKQTPSPTIFMANEGVERLSGRPIYGAQPTPKRSEHCGL